MKYTLLIYFLLYSLALIASPTDSISFEAQRKRVNELLDQRSKRFGDYTQSLEQKTGVFGLFKTKNDMQKSIDILKSVVINDNAIFLETRKLLNLKDSEAAHFQTLAKEYDQQITAFMKTISKLQAENELLRQNIKTLEEEDHQDDKYQFIVFAILLLGGVLFFVYKRRKTQNVTKV